MKTLLTITNRIRAGGGSIVVNPDGTISIVGQMQHESGSETAPSYSFTGDTDTGMFRIGADVLGFVVGGAARSFGIYSAQSEDFSFANTSPGQQSLFRIAAQDADGTDLTGLAIHGVGGRVSVTNSEELDILYLAATNEFVIRATQAGTGIQREFSLQIGTAKRVRMDSTGLSFFGVTPVARPAAYTVTNGLTDRAYDADATSVAELADVLGTVIADLQSLGLLQ